MLNFANSVQSCWRKCRKFPYHYDGFDDDKCCFDTDLVHCFSVDFKLYFDACFEAYKVACMW
jgi:hypothetical protein